MPLIKSHRLLYRNGAHMPTEEDIKTITAFIKNHGPAERENVLCWFHNYARVKRLPKNNACYGGMLCYITFNSLLLLS
jgi:hypothetical protein